MEKQPNSRLCFVCGLQNPLGLQLAFYLDEENGEAVTRATLRDEYQGYPGVVHGGIVTAILDETIGRAIIGVDDQFAFTARLNVRFLKPVPLEEEIEARGRITKERSRAFEAEGEITLADGSVAAEASGLFIRLPAEEAEQMKGELEFWEVVPDE